MTLSMSNAKITVEDGRTRFAFDATEAMISSLDCGETHQLSTSKLLNKVKTSLVPLPPPGFSIAPDKTEEPALTHEQKMGLASVIIRAKQIERQQFMNARAIQAAALEAQKLTAEAEHKFNLSVLEALHTGLTQEAIEKHLFDSGFSQLEEKVDTVHLLDTDMLYAVAQ